MAKQIQITKRQIPIEQILAIQGRSPVATGIETAGNVLGQALARKAELQRQGQQLARLESLAGQQPGSFTGLDPSMASTIANKFITDRSQNYTPEQLNALASGETGNISKVFTGGVPREAMALSSTMTSRKEAAQDRELRMQALAEEREKNRVEKRSKEKTDIVAKFNTDPGVRKIQSSVDASSNVRELVLSGNPIAASAIPTYMARASGEVGNLSEADKRPFGGSQAILQRMQAAFQQMATGRLTPDNSKFLLDLSDAMENSAIRNLDRRAKDLSDQYGQASDFLKPDDIYKTLRPIQRPAPRTITPKTAGRFIIEEE